MKSDIIKGDTGKISLMRVMAMFIVISVMSVFIAHNIVAMIKGGGFISMGSEEAMLVAGALAAKAGQRYAEGKKPMSTDKLPTDKDQ